MPENATEVWPAAHTTKGRAADEHIAQKERNQPIKAKPRPGESHRDGYGGQEEEHRVASGSCAARAKKRREAGGHAGCVHPAAPVLQLLRRLCRIICHRAAGQLPEISRGFVVGAFLWEWGRERLRRRGQVRAE